MIVHLAEIPDDGLELSLRLDLAAMARLTEAVGAQVGVLTAELRIRNRDGNVEINGRMAASLLPPCQRCLEAVALEIAETLHVALAPERAYERAPDDLNLGAADLELSFYAGEELDLQHILEDELLLLVPDAVAEEDDAGQCTVCGKRTDEMFPDEAGVAEDHPFARMKQLLNPD